MYDVGQITFLLCICYPISAALHKGLRVGLRVGLRLRGVEGVAHGGTWCIKGVLVQCAAQGA